MTRSIIQGLLLILVLGLPSFAVKESKGGDLLISRIRNQGRYLVGKLIANTRQRLRHEKGLEHFVRVVEKADIKLELNSTGKVLAAETVDDPTAAFGKRLIVYTERFEKFEKEALPKEVTRLIYHEFLNVAGEIDDKDQISQHLYIFMYELFDPAVIYRIPEEIPPPNPTFVEPNGNTSAFSIFYTLNGPLVSTPPGLSAVDEVNRQVKAIVKWKEKYASWKEQLEELWKKRIAKLGFPQLVSMKAKVSVDEPKFERAVVTQKHSTTNTQLGYYAVATGSVQLFIETDEDWKVEHLGTLPWTATNGFLFDITPVVNYPQAEEAFRLALQQHEEAVTGSEAAIEETYSQIYPVLFAHIARHRVFPQFTLSMDRYPMPHGGGYYPGPIHGEVVQFDSSHRDLFVLKPAQKKDQDYYSAEK